MLNLGTVAEDSIIYIPIPTRAADGSASTGNTLVDGDFAFHKDGSTTASTIDAAATTPSTDFAATTGRNQLAVDLSADSAFTRNSFWQVWLSKSIATETIEECVAVFRIESTSEKNLRLQREFLFPSDSTIATTTSNTTSVINLADIVDAQTADDALTNLMLAVHDATDDRIEFVRTTAVTGKVATVELIGDGGAMSFTVAAGDHVWIVGIAEARSAIEDKFTFTGGSVQADATHISGDSDSADNLELAYDGTGYDLGGIDVSELNAIVDDLLNGGRLDLLIDAIKTVTDQFTAAQAELAAPPAANATPLQKIAWMAMFFRNALDNDGTTQTLYADDGTTPVGNSMVSEAAGVVTRGEYAAPV